MRDVYIESESDHSRYMVVMYNVQDGGICLDGGGICARSLDAFLKWVGRPLLAASASLKYLSRTQLRTDAPDLMEFTIHL